MSRLFKKALAAVVCLLLLGTSPGPEAGAAFAAMLLSPEAGAPMPSAGAFMPMLETLVRADPRFLDSFYRELSDRLSELRPLRLPEAKAAYLLERAQPGLYTPASASAHFLILLAARPENAPRLLKDLATMPARTGAGPDIYQTVRFLAAHDLSELRPFLDRVTPEQAPDDLSGRLVLAKKLEHWKEHAYLGGLDGREVFAKLSGTGREVEMQQLASRIALPDNVLVPAVLALGQPGLPELHSVDPGRLVPSKTALKFATSGRRLLVTEALPKGSVHLFDVRLEQTGLSRPIAAADWKGLEGALDALHGAGLAHYDLQSANNIHLVQTAERTEFHLVDWELAARSGEEEHQNAKAENRSSVEKTAEILRSRGLLELNMIRGGGNEPDDELLPIREKPNWRGMAKATGLLLALSFAPALVSAHQAEPWGTPLPESVFRPAHLLIFAALGPALGWLNLKLADLVRRWTAKPSDPSEPAASRRKDPRLRDPFFLAVLPIRAFGEEFGFRVLGFHLILGLCAGLGPAWLAVPAAAFLLNLFFGLRHAAAGNVWGAFAGGVLYSAAYHLTGTIWLPSLAHFFHNLLVVLRSLRREDKPAPRP
jgi:hypothetical protein